MAMTSSNNNSNAVILSPREWLLAAALAIGTLGVAQWVWPRAEPLHAGPDYRLPYKLSSDYWLYSRWCRTAKDRGCVLVVGDSVVWGQYVGADETLSHYLNGRARNVRAFANMGLDGAHPAALFGLLKHYGQPIARTKVLLHMNLLWMSSQRRDLRANKEFRFNHPELVPQFWPRIPCYRASLNHRVRVVVGRAWPPLAWTRHLRLAYFGGLALPQWTIEHPYDNPLRRVSFHLPAPAAARPAPERSWTARGLRKQHFLWVKLDESLQWRFFVELARTLRRRGNEVFVLVGPLNEHLLDAESLRAYRNRRRSVEAWLRAWGVPYLAPPALPSQMYADASHPLRMGYARLADVLWADGPFRSFAGIAQDHVHEETKGLGLQASFGSGDPS